MMRQNRPRYRADLLLGMSETIVMDESENSSTNLCMQIPVAATAAMPSPPRNVAASARPSNAECTPSPANETYEFRRWPWRSSSPPQAQTMLWRLLSQTVTARMSRKPASAAARAYLRSMPAASHSSRASGRSTRNSSPTKIPALSAIIMCRRRSDSEPTRGSHAPTPETATIATARRARTAQESMAARCGARY